MANGNNDASNDGGWERGWQKKNFSLFFGFIKYPLIFKASGDGNDFLFAMNVEQKKDVSSPLSNWNDFPLFLDGSAQEKQEHMYWLFFLCEY